MASGSSSEMCQHPGGACASVTGFGSPRSPLSPPQGNTGCEMIRSPSSLLGVTAGKSCVSKCCTAISGRTFSEVYRPSRVHISRNPKDGEMGVGHFLPWGPASPFLPSPLTSMWPPSCGPCPQGLQPWPSMGTWPMTPGFLGGRAGVQN